MLPIMGPDMKHFHLWSAALAIGLGVGCARGQNSAVTANEQPALDPADRSCELLLAGLQHGEYARVEGVFSAEMKQALPVERLEAHWMRLRADVGDLVSWHASGRDNPSNVEQRRYELHHERGTLEAKIVFGRGGDRVIGLFFSRLAQNAASHESTNPEVAARDVTIGSGPFSIGATITSPKNETGASSAAVLLVAGSGPQDRDESTGPNKPFRDLAEGLSARGIVVLRFDKRTMAHVDEYIKAGSATVTNEIIDDAVEALRYLHDLPHVDSQRLFIVGHSLGALVAPDIASRAGAIAGLALLGVPGRPIPELMLEQMKYAGVPAPELQKLEQKLKQLAARQLGADEIILGAAASYWWDLMDRDEPAMAKRLGKPVLLVRGERDFQTSAADQAIWQTALNAQARSVTLSGLNHLFLQGTGKSTPAEYMTPGKVDPALIGVVAAFVLGGER
jgi:dienelactone hydrolase